jgi:hypothetical protein
VEPVQPFSSHLQVAGVLTSSFQSEGLGEEPFSLRQGEAVRLWDLVVVHVFFLQEVVGLISFRQEVEEPFPVSFLQEQGEQHVS